VDTADLRKDASCGRCSISTESPSSPTPCRRPLADVGRALRADDGVLAGAVNSMRDAVAFVAVDLGLPLADALRKAISPPARFGLDHQIGRFVPGARANLVHLTGSLAVARAWVGGCDARELAGAQ
jgi:N-acetylglucosamine-6-phosphate deacetylase